MTVCAALAMAGSLEYQTRALGVLMAALFATLGLALFAAPPSVATTSAGQIFYGVGFTGIRLLIDVLIADASDFRYRALGYAFVASPWAISAFAVPIMRRIYSISQLRRAVAAFAVIVPLLGLTLCAYLWHHRRKAADYGYLIGPENLCSGLRRLGTKIRTAHLPSPKRRIRLTSMFAFWKWRAWGLFTWSTMTFFIVVTLLCVFVVLWLVQMGKVPWNAPLPCIFVFFALVAFLIALKYDRFNLWMLKRSQRFLRSLFRAVGDTWPYRLSDSIFDRFLMKEDNIGPGNSLLLPMRNKNMLAVCAIAITWRCKSTDGTSRASLTG